jgi:hypothetical protein
MKSSEFVTHLRLEAQLYFWPPFTIEAEDLPSGRVDHDG